MNILDKVALTIGWFCLNTFVLGCFQAAVLNVWVDDLSVAQKLLTGLLAVIMTGLYLNKEYVYSQAVLFHKEHLNVIYEKLKKRFLDKDTANLDLITEKKHEDSFIKTIFNEDTIDLLQNTQNNSINTFADILYQKKFYGNLEKLNSISKEFFPMFDKESQIITSFVEKGMASYEMQMKLISFLEYFFNNLL